MNKIIRYILIILATLAFLFPQEAKAQGFVGLRRDTTIYIEGHSIVFQQISADMLKEVLENFPPPPIFNIVADIDSVTEMLKGKVEFVFDPNVYDDGQRYVSSITCRNGMKLNFAESVLLEKYYPKYDIIKFKYDWVVPQWIFDLKTGDYDYEPEYTRYSKSGKLRTVANTVFKDLHDLELQILNGKTKKFSKIVNLTDFVDHEFSIGDYFWIGEIFYVYDSENSRWWRLGVKESTGERRR
ncbi:MAG: hypothetical protein FWG22_02660 [Prolixibacteraceae bacterium]|nr:hypothetical protein [Prolixibacteraceae bacterium]